MKNKFFITLFACLLPWMAGAQQTISKQNNVAEKDYIAYLFTYFTGNHISEEAVCYAVSTDGYTYWALNDNKPVIDSKIISSTGGTDSGSCKGNLWTCAQCSPTNSGYG